MSIDIKIPFNKPSLAGNELDYIQDAVRRGHLSGNGPYTKKCHALFENRYGFKKALLTTSCTAALEMCALLADIQPGDEVIVPSYTFVSSALAFVRQGANIVFCDSRDDHPGMVETIESLITPRTKVIVVVHYAGVAVDMDPIMAIANRHQILVVEDAAQAIESTYKGRQLGTIGHLGTFSFHETKNVQAGEGGLLGINDERFVERSEILWEKGTNRAQFFRGQIDKYTWVDTGSSFLPSDLTAAYLLAQLERMEQIQQERLEIWRRYEQSLEPSPSIPDFATNNAHMFYIVKDSEQQANSLIQACTSAGILAVTHYRCLHTSPFYRKHHASQSLKNANRYERCLVRLPLFCGLGIDEQNRVIEVVKKAS